jgi:hypothetical protein
MMVPATDTGATVERDAADGEGADLTGSDRRHEPDDPGDEGHAEHERRGTRRPAALAVFQWRRPRENPSHGAPRSMSGDHSLVIVAQIAKTSRAIVGHGPGLYMRAYQPFEVG